MNTALFSSAAVFIFLIPIFLILVVLILYFYYSLKKREKEITREREESTRRLYELTILKELGERVGYSLNVEEILQIITGSLKQFIDYTAVGYIVIAPEKIKINTHIEKSVSRSFLSEMKERMIASLSALTDKSFGSYAIDEVVSGAIVVDEIKQSIGSLFNIPLVIGGTVVGVLTVAHLDAGLYKEEDMTILYKITGRASEAVSRLQEVVEMEKGKLNAMVLSMGDGVLMVDTEYRVIVANPAIKKIIKFNPLTGGKDVSFFDFVDALGGKFDIHGRLEEVIKKKNPYYSERININDSFFEIGVCPVSHPMVKGGDQILGAVVVFHDITKEIELERVREEFTSMIVHELRSPLDGIKKIVELMVSGSIMAGSDKFKEYLNMAHQSSVSMLELINDILDFSKLQAGKFEVNKERADIKEIVENRISFYKISTDAKNISLQSSFSENLPQYCDFDQRAIRQILNNFISNAIKFTSHGGSILVSVFAYKPGEPMPKDLVKDKIIVFPEAADIKINVPALCVVVSDTGAGISENSLQDLFHTYKQVRLNSADDENKGTGLGLVIAKGIAEAHNGNIGVVSKEGMGSSFFFTIPLN
jgi:two-component system, NtrC family, sensor histidine kinase KinB